MREIVKTSGSRRWLGEIFESARIRDYGRHRDKKKEALKKFSTEEALTHVEPATFVSRALVKTAMFQTFHKVPNFPRDVERSRK